MKHLQDFSWRGKRALVRVDFNVPMKGEEIQDTGRIDAALPTIRYLLDQGARVVLMSHLGRPKGEAKAEFSLTPVAKALEEKLGQKVSFLPSDVVVDEKVKEGVDALKDGEVALLENTRYRKEEEKNGEEFAKDLASLGDIYVNDAFGTSHRAHASNVGVSALLPSTFGFLVAKEVEALSGMLNHPKRPFVAILGGAKVSDKIGVIEHLLERIDGLIIVGAMANTFLRAKGYATGSSLVEEDRIGLAKEVMEKAKDMDVDLLLPVDLVVAKSFDAEEGHVVSVEEIGDDEMALDIGPKSLEVMGELLKKAKNVIWNGPAGVFEKEAFAKGTMGLVDILADGDAEVIVGGGDSASAVKLSGRSDDFAHISTGGGASLEFMEGKVLPGIEAIEGGNHA